MSLESGLLNNPWTLENPNVTLEVGLLYNGKTQLPELFKQNLRLDSCCSGKNQEDFRSKQTNKEN